MTWTSESSRVHTIGTEKALTSISPRSHPGLQRCLTPAGGACFSQSASYFLLKWSVTREAKSQNSEVTYPKSPWHSQGESPSPHLADISPSPVFSILVRGASELQNEWPSPFSSTITEDALPSPPPVHFWDTSLRSVGPGMQRKTSWINLPKHFLKPIYILRLDCLRRVRCRVLATGFTKQYSAMASDCQGPGSRVNRQYNTNKRVLGIHVWRGHQLSHTKLTFALAKWWTQRIQR